MKTLANESIGDATLQAESEELRRRLEEAEETLRAIRGGTIDALVLSDAQGERIFTLETADRPYRLLVEQMQQAAVTLSADGTIIYCNRRLAVLLGVPHPKLTGTALADFISLEDRFVYEAMLRGRKSGSWNCEISLSHADGARIPALVSVNDLPKDSGAVLGVLITDLTTQRHHEQLAAAHEALRESEERFRMLADNMSQLAWICDQLGHVTWYNKRWLEYTGLSFEEMRDWGWKKVHHPDHVDRVVASVTRSRESGEIWDETFPLRGKDGGYRWFLSRAYPIRDEQGKVVRWFGTNTDITDLREVQAQLAAANEQLASRARQLDTLVEQRTAKLRETIEELESYSYSISHDMRAPLRAMTSYAQVLLTDHGNQLDAHGRRYLDRIMSSSLRLDKLIQDVLSYSRIARGEVECEPVNLDRLVEDICNEYPSIRAAEVEICHPLGSVAAAEALLAQTISNLLTNAAKFVAPGQTPRIRIWSETIPPSASAGTMVKLYIQDCGIGIAPQDQPRIFGIFARVYSEREYEGTGIGLSIVKKAVEHMNGQVGLHSEPGKGSTFWLQLPKA